MRRRSRVQKFDFLVLVIACAAVALGLNVGALPSAAGVTGSAFISQSKSGIAGWTTVGSYTENTLSAGEGVATVSQHGHKTYELYRGLASVPSNLKAEGWAHIGDPDSVNGYVFDAYQGPSSGTSKMFLVTTPSGQSLEYLHALVPGELYNNSFVAVSPDRQWMIAGDPVAGGAALTWQAMDSLRFHLATGTGPQSVPERAGTERAGLEILSAASVVLSPLPAVTPTSIEAVRRALAGWRVTLVVIPDPAYLYPRYDRGASTAWALGAFTLAIGREPVYEHQAWVWSGVDDPGASLSIPVTGFARCTAADVYEKAPLAVPECVSTASRRP